MSYARIDTKTARKIALILKDECLFDQRNTEEFVRSVITTRKRKYQNDVCREYRFMAALGFGGKFRNNGNFDNTPYVDCYPEDMTPIRRGMIDRANERIKKLFGEP
jgi:hypothetical protein